MMKNIFASMTLAVVLCMMVFWLGGCRYPVKAADFVGETVEDVVYLGSGEEFAQLGETEAEGRRRQERIKRLQRQQLMEDIDTFLLIDEPSKLTDKRIP